MIFDSAFWNGILNNLYLLLVVNQVSILQITSENTFQALTFLIAIVGIYILAVGLRYQFVRRRGIRSPFVEEFLRLPGHSERFQRLELFDELSDKYNLFLLSSVMLVFSGLFFESLLSLIIIVVSILGVTYSLRKSYIIHRAIQKANLKCDGEEYTGLELNQLLAQGADVFHDIPFEQGNIDHIVVGFDKVFVVETLAVEKSLNMPGDSKAVATVVFDEDKLIFPHLDSRLAIDRVKVRCEFLKARIKENCDLDFPVMPVIALPGWFVDIKKKQKAEILIINPKRGTGLKAWLGKSKNQPDRAQVLDYLSSVARSIPPTSRRTDSSADDQYEFWLSPRYRDRVLKQ